MKEINTIIFDVGRVLIDYCPEQVLNQLLPHSPHKKDYLNHLLLSPLWHDLDQGVLLPEEVPEKLAPLIGQSQEISNDIHHILSHYVDVLAEKPESKALFLELQKQYPIYILSNFQEAPFKKLLSLQPYIGTATGIVVSATIKHIKPDPKIYDYILETYKLRPETCVFIDDMPENIDACRKKGMHGIVFNSIKQVRSELKQLRVQVKELSQ